MNLFIALGVITVATVGSELILWMMFMRRMKPLQFPSELDTSYFRFFEARRLRIIAILHTILLLAVFYTLYSFLW